jgi:aldehyde dehydrogenase (NAD+)
MMPIIAMGNTAVVIPSETSPLSATDFYQVIETSDVPPGVVNIITGRKEVLAPVLASHLDVDGLWYFGDRKGSQLVEYESAGNMKRTWVNYGKFRDWRKQQEAEGQEFLRQATQVKNIWIPYGG